MNNIEQHISDLLMQHNCVVVPRLGGFVGSYQSAVMGEDGRGFKPPYKEVIFNKALSHNDGLLINSYSRKFGMSYADAERDVCLFVDELLAKLAKGNFVSIAEIGTFRSDLLGNFYFIQAEGSNFLAQSFGLDEIHALPLSQAERTSQRFESKSKVFVRMLANRRVAASVAAVVGLFIFSTTFVVKDVEKYNYGSLLGGLNAENVESKTVEPIVETSVATIPLVESTDVAKPVMTKSESVTANSEIVVACGHPFHIIAASVKNRNEAEELVTEFRKVGKSATKIVEVNGRFRISIEQFSSKELAIKSMDSYRTSNQYKSVWVFKEK